MKNFTYIEHIVNDPVNDEGKNSFITRLINNPGLRKEYQKYIKLEYLVNEQEERLGGIIKELADFTFNVNRAIDARGNPDDLINTVQDQDTSRLIRSVIASNRPQDAREKKRWFRAASVLGFLLFILSPGTTATVVVINKINLLNVSFNMIFQYLIESNFLL